MNDFTKEELNYLNDLMSRARVNPCVIDDSKLHDKIQSLIENYPKCDHRSGYNYYNEDGQISLYPTDIYRCKHCDILFKFSYENGMCIGHEDLE